jgi:hypothetical protein
MFIINMLMTIGLLAAFVVVADRVFRLSLVTVNKATAGQEDALRLERAIDALRADVWTSAKVEPAADGAWLKVSSDKGDGIEWKDEGADLVRSQGSEERRWPGVAVRFRVENGVVVVSRNGWDVAVVRRAGGGR